MDKKMEHKLMRKDFSPVGWSMLVYFILMLVCVTLADVFYLYAMTAFTGAAEEEIHAAVEGNAWGYLLTIGIGVLIVWLWKGKSFCVTELFARGRPMKVGDFFCLLSVFMMGQMAFQWLSVVQEMILNLFGLTAVAAVESATASSETLSMFLYVAFGAPIAEELLCRGLILRPLVKYGKRFAILMSAFFFGLFHCNIVQTPFAFVVGLIMGYVAVEYNILWAMVLHMINNLVIGDLIVRVFGETIGNTITGLLIIGLTVAGFIILIVRRDETKAYVKANKVNNEAVHCFFTSPGVITASVFFLLYMIFAFLVMQ